MINIEVTSEELRALITGLEILSFTDGFAFRKRDLILRLKNAELQYLNEKTPESTGAKF